MTNKLEQIIKKDQQYYFNTFGERTPLVFDYGAGSYLFDHEGKGYLDMLGGIAVNALGHGNQALVDAIKQQAEKVLHTSNIYYIEDQALLAEQLCTLSGMEKAFFCNSGAEANETAFKLVRAYFNRQHENRPLILSATASFHGRTLATSAATGQSKYNAQFSPLPPGFAYTDFNDIDDFKSKLGPDVAAVILELIQGESGVHPLDQAYVTEVSDLCQSNGSLLIIDEIQTGIGRTGYFTASEAYNITPDIMTFAKSLGGGVPVGAMLARGKVKDAFIPGDHGSTFGGNPLAMAASLAVINEILAKDLMEHVRVQSRILKTKLSAIPAISNVRGMGFILGFDIIHLDAATLKKQLMDEGILVGSVGPSSIRLLPPYTLSIDEIDTFIDTLKKLLD